jgi:hypothetical protein
MFSFVQFDILVYLFHIGLVFFQTISFCNATFGVCYICFQIHFISFGNKENLHIATFLSLLDSLENVLTFFFNQHWYSCGVHRIQFSNIALRNTTFISLLDFTKFHVFIPNFGVLSPIWLTLNITRIWA